MYLTLKNFDGTPANCCKHEPTGAIIPFDPANTDYQEYLKWLSEGNTPEPPDQPE